jgi:ankyrin repeat protein
MALAAALIGAGASQALAQSSATPFSDIPHAPKTFPIVGPSPFAEAGLPLVTAAAANDTNGVAGLLDARVSPNEVETYGRTALIYAAMNDNSTMAQALLGHGAKLDIHDKLGKTALHWAAERGSVNVMRLLLQANAPIDIQTRDGLTPLMLAARNGKTAAVRLLLEHHADPRKNDYTGRDALSWAANRVAIVDALKAAEVR